MVGRRSLPQEEQFGLNSQIRRAAVSIPANIAEGAARGTQKEFKQFLTVSRGSLSELETLILIAKDVEFLAKEKYGELEQQASKVSRLISGLITSLRVS